MGTHREALTHKDMHTLQQSKERFPNRADTYIHVHIHVYVLMYIVTSYVHVQMYNVMVILHIHV